MNRSRGVADLFNSQCNKVYLADDYHSFLKQQNIVFTCIGKPVREERYEFEKKGPMNENKNNTDAYENLKKDINHKK